MISSFFGAKVVPNNYYRGLIRDDLVITRAVIDPEAPETAHSRLFIQIEKTEGPVADLYATQNVSVPLNIHVSAGFTLTLRVAGDAPVHVSGYFDSERNPFSSNRPDSDSSPQEYYYYSDVEDEEANEEEKEGKENEEEEHKEEPKQEEAEEKQEEKENQEKSNE